MRTLWIILCKEFKKMSIYRINAISYLFSGYLLLEIQLAIWKALYTQNMTDIGSLEETMTYIVLSIAFFQPLTLQVGLGIGRAVYQGSIGEELIKPIQLQWVILARELGASLFCGCFCGVPLLCIAIGKWCFLAPAGLHALFAFVLVGLLGKVIGTLINFILGYSAFWLMNNWYISFFERALMILFGGTLIPMWFFPEWINKLSDFLPFKFIQYYAIEIYLGRLTFEKFFWLLQKQLLWIGILFLIERSCWLFAQRKIVIQGG